MGKIKLTIQNGHRNVTNGQTGTSGVYNGVRINEVDLIDKVYYGIKSIIDKKYTQTIELSYDDTIVNNGKTADLFMALHFDGSANTASDGGFVDDCPKCPNNGVQPCDNQSDASWAFATKIADYYFNAIGIRFAPEHRTKDSTYYYAFNSTGINTKQFIIELGTMTNVNDMSKIQNADRIAQLLMNGIVAYTGIVQDTIVQPTQPPIVIDPKDKQITDLKNQLNELNTSYNNLNSNYINLGKDISSLKDQLAKSTNSLTELNNKINSIKKILI